MIDIQVDWTFVVLQHAVSWIVVKLTSQINASKIFVTCILSVYQCVRPLHFQMVIAREKMSVYLKHLTLRLQRGLDH